jgi:RNA polymerase sigma-70 factor (ECF subfamily)
VEAKTEAMNVPRSTAASPERSFEQFFQAMRPQLTGQAYLLTGSLEDAHDLTQETLWRVWKNWERVRSLDQPAAWARHVLANLVIGRWRSNRRQEWMRRTSHEESDAPAERIVSHVDVVAALARLPWRQRRAIVLRDFVGLSVREISGELSVPEGTVKSWLSRGRQAMAPMLGESEEQRR